jgi:ABC-2 type transport system permease protein
MRAILDIAINDLRILFKDPGIWINLVVIPLILAYVIGAATGSMSSGAASAPTLIIDVINRDDGTLSQQFLADLKASNPNFLLCPQNNNAGDGCGLGDAAYDDAWAETRLQDQTSLALIDIPTGFSAAIDAGENASIVYRSNEDASAPSYILQAVQAETQRLGGSLLAARVGMDVTADLSGLTFANDAERAEFSEAIRQRAAELWAKNPARVEYVVGEEVQTEVQPSGFSQSIPGIGSMYVMFMVIPAAAALILERKNWTLQRLASLPISKAQILGGKLLSRFAVGMLEYVLIFSFGLLVLRIEIGSDPLALVLLAVSFTLAITALTLALSTLTRTEQQAQGIGLFLTLTLTPLGGAWWPLDIVPEWMRLIGHISPVAWVMDGFRSVIFYGGSLGTVITPILVLLGMAVVFFAIGVRRFKFTN